VGKSRKKLKIKNCFIMRNSIIILLSAVLLSCTSKTEVAKLQLLPQPQEVEMGEGMHVLTNKEINPSVIVEKIVSEIPEATINSDEAYRLQITPDSVFIKATTNKGIYWANQTLAQIVEFSEENPSPHSLLPIIPLSAFAVLCTI